MNILHIISSPAGNNSTSSKLSNTIVERLKISDPEINLKELIVNDFPHVNQEYIIAAYTIPNEERSERQKEILKTSDKVIQQLFWADKIVIGLPMHNYGIPSSLKAWIDHISRPGITFSFSAAGKLGLVINKKVFIAISSGGLFTNTEDSGMDHTENYLRTVLGFLGMTDVKVFRAEGLAIPDVKDKALETALRIIETAL